MLFSSTDPALRNVNGIWRYNDRSLSGHIIEKRGDSVIANLPILNGRESGVAHGWFASGEKRYARAFKNGSRDGEHRVWYRSGQLAGVSFFVDDKLEGEQISYFENGRIWEARHYTHGHEEGVQKAWSQDGRVVNNFTVKNGKLYGVIGRYDCMSVAQPGIDAGRRDDIDDSLLQPGWNAAAAGGSTTAGDAPLLQHGRL